MNENIIVAITKLNEIVTDIDKDDTCFLDIKDTVEEVIALLKAKDTNVPTKWVSVKDRLPEHGKRYLIYATSEDGNEHHITIAAYGGHFALSGRCAYWKVTHWMPLPEPPKENEDDDE